MSASVCESNAVQGLNMDLPAAKLKLSVLSFKTEIILKTLKNPANKPRT